MRMNPIEMKVHLDKRYKSSEILNFLIDEGFNGRFIPLFTDKMKEFAPFESTDEFLKAAVIGDLTSVPKNIKSDTIYGAFPVVLKGKSIPVSRVNRPRIIQGSSGRLHLNWSEIQPAMVIDIHTHSFPGEYIFYADVIISHGLWGTRHRWLKALLNVLEKQASAESVKSLWENDKTLLDNLRSDFEDMRKLETGIIDFQEIRDSMWNTMSSLCNKFSTDGQTVYVSPDFRKRSTIVPVDISTCCTDQPASIPLKIPDSAWRSSAWLDCLSANSPDVLRERTVKYWTACEDEKTFLKMVEDSEKGGKDTWDSIVEIMTKRPETETILTKLINWQADPNWPGSLAARSHLINNVGLRAIPHIKQSIELAKQIGDDWWEENLEDLLGEIGRKA